MRRLALLALLLACTRTPAVAQEPPPEPARERSPEQPPPREPAPAMSWLGADWLTRPERISEEQPDAMLDALGVTPGMRVADIGAGVGYHALRLSTRVGAGGKVYATDLQPEMLALLRTALAEAKVDNVEPVQSRDEATGLAAASIDLALMVDVYHELAEPAAFMRDLRRALAPGGRVVLVEFRGEDPEVPIREEHKLTVAQADAELRAHGFARIARHDFLPWQHILVYRPRP